MGGKALKKLPLHFYNADVYSKLDKLGEIVYLKLFHDVLAVGFHSFDAQKKQGGDFFGALAFGDQLDHFPFSLSQDRKRRETFLRNLIDVIFDDPGKFH